MHEDVNLGIAVALEDGLVVPVIRRAQRLSVEGMAAAIADVATRARERRAHPRRHPRRDVHDHQPRSVRGGAGDADHQPAAGRDPRRRGGGASGRWRRRRLRRRRDRGAADGLPVHVVGPPRARRRGGGAVPGERSRAGRGGARNEPRRLRAGRGRSAARAAARRWRSPSTRPCSARRSAARGCGTTRPSCDAVADAKRLAHAMTLKAAAAGLDLGGGKGVIAAPPGTPPERRAAAGDAARLRRPGRGARRRLRDRRGRRHRRRRTCP